MNYRTLFLIAALGSLQGCLNPPPAPRALDPSISRELDKGGERRTQAPPRAVDEAMLPPLRMDMPSVAGQPIDPRFDLLVNNAPAQQVFMSLVSGTRYSMLVHPGVTGTISVSLKDVTLREALEAIRDLYGYEFRFDGSRISIQPAGLQTRVFRVNYLTGLRRGSSDLRVQSGSVADVRPGPAGPTPVATAAQPFPGTTGATGQLPVAGSLESARISTQQTNDFWTELRTSLQSIVGTAPGRSVVVTPQSGLVLVRAMPDELRGVEQYLRETRLSVERQVMLEAKILEVTLSDAYQSGINWAVFRNKLAVGQLSTGTGSTQLSGSASALPLSSGGETVDTAARSLVASAATSGSNPASAVFGLAFRTANFAALLQFLETQGHVQVLSSPRVATINNQKAVLKVGTDEFFVTNVSTVTQVTGTTSVQTPTVTVAPFFSGILLDVTPRIDENDNIMLHIHPSVSQVSESRRVVDLGGSVPSITLPLAKSTVSETDTIVRVSNSNIVAIGGLMSVQVTDDRGGIPGLDIGILRNVNRTTTKKELVILLKPTVIGDETDWEPGTREAQERMRTLYPREERRQ